MVCCGSVLVIPSISSLVVLSFLFSSMILCVYHILYQGCSRSVSILHIQLFCFFPVLGFLVCSVPVSGFSVSSDLCLGSFFYVFLVQG